MDRTEYENAIEIRGLVKEYDDFTLQSIDLTLPKGYIMGIIGKNGAGKTTIIKSMLGLISKDAGTVNIMGCSIDDDNSRHMKEYIGVVLDDSGFPEEMNIKDLSMIMNSCYKTWDSKSFNRYIKEFSLPERKKIKDYSKGMKMKLSIAVALSHESRLLILDEATSGLDPIVRDEVLDILRDFIQDENKSIFISSHILSDLEKICDYITFVNDGSVEFSENKDELLEKYGILKCSQAEFAQVDEDAVAAYKRNEFGMEALVERKKINQEFTIDDASIEDIMLYYIKEGRR